MDVGGQVLGVVTVVPKIKTLQGRESKKVREWERERKRETEKDRAHRERQSTHERTSVSVDVSESETASEVVTGVPEIKTLYETERAIVS